MTKPDLPPVDRASRPTLAPMEVYYLRALRHWFRYRRAAPSLGQLAVLCRKSGAPTTARGLRKPAGWPSKRAIRRGLLALEEKGYAQRNDQGRFEVIR